MSESSRDEHFLREAIALAGQGLTEGRGGPFGALIVRDGEIIGQGQNTVTVSCDPTAHAEVNAIRDACRRTGEFSLEDATIYASCEPCPMCLSAIYWARIERIVYGATHDDAAAIGFDDAFLYEELTLPPFERRIPAEQLLGQESLVPFAMWEAFEAKTPY